MTARRIQYPAGSRFGLYTDFQLNYMNHLSGWLVPGTEVWVGDTCWMRINSLGCKGPELDPSRGTVGIFGDSATFGMALDARAEDSWPAHVHLPGYQMLNAAIEGHAFDRVCARYEELKASVSFCAVVIGGTWHNLLYNECDERAWLAYFTRFSSAPALAICTLATSLTPESTERGLDPLISGEGARFFGWGTWPTGPSETRAAYEAVLRYNEFVRRYCRQTGAALIDLFGVCRPASYDAIPDLFLDPAHARPELYPAFAECARIALERVLPARAPRSAHARGAAAGRQLPVQAVPAPAASEPHELNHNVYPLW